MFQYKILSHDLLATDGIGRMEKKLEFMDIGGWELVQVIVVNDVLMRSIHRSQNPIIPAGPPEESRTSSFGPMI